jgi:hypothetical protein
MPARVDAWYAPDGGTVSILTIPESTVQPAWLQRPRRFILVSILTALPRVLHMVLV